MDSSSTTRPDDIPIKDSVLPLLRINAQIFVVAIGDDVSKKELEEIAGEDNIVYADDHDDLEDEVDDLIELIGSDECKGTWFSKFLPTKSS